MPLSIHKSSAGSGKTYTLAREYIKLALRSADYYQKILAVTFTNRAAEEMKDRVLDFLMAISKGKHELISIYAEELNLPEEQIVSAAKDAVTHLLHHYAYFNITTIDTFFHRVIRSFSREIGLKGNFGIELDEDKVAEFITSGIFEGVGENQQLKEWLVTFSMDGLMAGEGYEVRGQIDRLAKQLFQEDFKSIPQDQFSSERFKNEVGALKTKLFEIKAAFETTLREMASSFYQILDRAELTVEDLLYKSAGPGGFFQKLDRLEFDTLLTKRVESARENPGAWTSKSSAHNVAIQQLASDEFIPMMNKALDYYQEGKEQYYTATVVLKHLQTLGLMNDLYTKLQDYKAEEEVIMISDLPDFLSQIIDDTGSPFIYEKVGTWYSHFLIDEFQDTSQMQWNNFKPLLEESLSSGHENFLVGDAKQSIYGWRGGDPTILTTKVQEEFGSMVSDDHAQENINWRSARNIVEFNNQLFTNLPTILARELQKDTQGHSSDGIAKMYEESFQQVAKKNEQTEGLVHLEFLEAEKAEWKKVAIQRTIELIEDLLEKGHGLNDIALLVRTNKEATDIVDQVFDYRRNADTKIEVISAEGMLLAHSAIVQLILATFRHLLNPSDLAVKADLTFRYQKLVKKKDFTSHADFVRLTGAGGLPPTFTKYKQHLLHLPIQEIVEVLIRTFELNTIRDEYAYLQAFQDAVLEFSKNRRSDLRLFMEWWEEYGKKRSVQLAGALGAVEIITSHKSKGLQFPIVIVPFCNFDMNSRSKPVWYESPYEEGSFLPVDYKSELEKTAFVSSYYEEFVKNHLESLNILYVAFTRAETGLFVISEAPSSRREKMYGTTSKLLWTFFEENATMPGWDGNAKVFRKGTLPINHRKQEGTIVQLEHYLSNKWSDRLQVRKVGKAYYDDEVEKSRNEGVLLHQILSEIKHLEETADVLEKYEKDMQITKEDRAIYQALFDRLWKDEIVKSWFNGEGEVKTEVLVLPKDGEIKRMDRVVINGENAIVIDFKSGRPKSGDKNQLSGYIRLLQEMGYTTQGYLLYLKTGETVKLEELPA